MISRQLAIRMLRRSDASKAHNNISDMKGGEYKAANFRAKFIEPFRVAIVALISHPVITSVGNRAQLVFNAVNGGLLVRFAIDQSLNGDVGNIKYGVAVSIAALLVSTAFCGANTANMYARTKRRIEQSDQCDQLSEAFLAKATDSYCTTQGVYLATKKTRFSNQVGDYLNKYRPIQRAMIG